MTIEEMRERYWKLAHAMQSGVAAWMNYDPLETSVKHLRVGVNSAMADVGSLGRLLVKKGVISEEEYTEAVMEGMEREVASYEEQLSERMGKRIHLL